MKVSLNLAQFYSNVNLKQQSADQLAKLLGEKLGAVEEVISTGSMYDRVYVVKIVSCEKHPDADKLNVCLIDDGQVAKDVARNKDGLVQVVCGAPNARAGITVAWLPPGSTVPSSVNVPNSEPFVLSVRPLRGVDSNGMLASATELAMFEDHSGILEINSEEVGEELSKPGTEFKRLFGIDDVVLDLENKMFTHRPDAWGHLGIAREIAALYGEKFVSPEWYVEGGSLNSFQGPEQMDAETSSANELTQSSNESSMSVEIFNEAGPLVPRLTAVCFDNIVIKDSPTWVKAALIRVGMRPINNIVDITNFLMIITGQPTHAFDYDKLATLCGGQARLGARMSQAGEELTLLDGKVVKFDDDQTIVISTKSVIAGSDPQSSNNTYKALAIGGVKGGADSEVDENTKRIVLEVANFDMYSIRRATMKYGVFTDASSRFNKGQSPYQNLAVINYAIKLLAQSTGADLASPIYDTNPELSSLDRPATEFTAEFINDRLGLNLSAKEITEILERVECKIVALDPLDKPEDDAQTTLSVQAPFWRMDLESGEDYVEEIGRIYGYDLLPVELPVGTIKAVGPEPMLRLKQSLRTKLAGLGANEILTYNFTHGNVLQKVGIETSEAHKIKNALSPELQYFRVSLTPGILEKIHPNIKSDMVRTDGRGDFALFELGKVHNTTDTVTESTTDRASSSGLSRGSRADTNNLPEELTHLGLVFTSDIQTAKRYTGSSYYVAKRYLSEVLPEAEFTQVPAEQDIAKLDKDLQLMLTPYEPTRSALVTLGGKMVGIVGEYKQSVRSGFKLPDYTSGFEVQVDESMLNAGQGYAKIGKFPSTNVDMTYESDLNYADIYNLITTNLSKLTNSHSLNHTLTPTNIYQAEGSSTKRYSFRLWLSHDERTLDKGEVNELLESLSKDTGLVQI
jgi:phenylalanyl-tRNA synthetase beta chain